MRILVRKRDDMEEGAGLRQVLPGFQTRLDRERQESFMVAVSQVPPDDDDIHSARRLLQRPLGMCLHGTHLYIADARASCILKVRRCDGRAAAL